MNDTNKIKDQDVEEVTGGRVVRNIVRVNKKSSGNDDNTNDNANADSKDNNKNSKFMHTIL